MVVMYKPTPLIKCCVPDWTIVFTNGIWQDGYNQSTAFSAVKDGTARTITLRVDGVEIGWWSRESRDEADDDGVGL